MKASYSWFHILGYMVAGAICANPSGAFARRQVGGTVRLKMEILAIHVQKVWVRFSAEPKKSPCFFFMKRDQI